jgi:hypothetical protein
MRSRLWSKGLGQIAVVCVVSGVCLPHPARAASSDVAGCINYEDHAHWAGGLDTPGEALDISITGSYALVADGPSGLQVMDISDPLNTRIVGNVQTPGSARCLAISGVYAYVGNLESGLQVIDVSVPEAPQIVGSVMTPEEALGVATQGSYAYVADLPRRPPPFPRRFSRVSCRIQALPGSRSGSRQPDGSVSRCASSIRRVAASETYTTVLCGPVFRNSLGRVAAPTAARWRQETI